MLILTRRNPVHPTKLIKLHSTDILDVRTPKGEGFHVALSRNGQVRIMTLAVYETEDRAEEVLAQMARFSADLMRTPGMDPLFIMPLDKPDSQE